MPHTHQTAVLYHVPQNQGALAVPDVQQGSQVLTVGTAASLQKYTDYIVLSVRRHHLAGRVVLPPHTHQTALGC